MQIGIVGLGRMGAGMARRLARAGVRVVCHDQADGARASVAGEPGIDCAENLAALCARLDGERVILLMLPPGAVVEETISALAPLIATGDTLVDGGNSYYRDSMRRALALSQQGLRYIDAGVSPIHARVSPRKPVRGARAAGRGDRGRRQRRCAGVRRRDPQAAAYLVPSQLPMCTW